MSCITVTANIVLEGLYNIKIKICKKCNDYQKRQKTFLYTEMYDCLGINSKRTNKKLSELIGEI